MASPKARKVPLAKSKILRAYAAKTPGSAKLHLRARDLFPGAVTHVGRYLKPHPLFVSRAAGSHKWDVDGNEYVDYFGGHGALMLGHNYPAVVEAVEAQVKKGSHYGASHELEIEWAQLIKEMVPCAERIRFTSSGTEATMLAMRVARAFTRKNAVLRFQGHFHGWHDQAAASADLAPGIPKETADLVVLCPPNDFAALKQILESRNDITAVILEPTGATFGQIPTPVEFLYELRELTRRRHILLIFDEVITGFRCSPGGVQWEHGITPDLVTLAKIVAGGYPGGVLAGRSDILEVLQHRDGEPIAGPPVAHQGTFNANPVSAAAGIATLRLIRDGDFISKANKTAAAIRDGMKDVLKRRSSVWCVYGDYSGFHIFCNSGPDAVSPADIYAGKVHWSRLKGATPIALLAKIRAGFLLHGVDIIGWPGGVVSGVHSGDDVDRTVTAFENVVGMLAAEGDL